MVRWVVVALFACNGDKDGKGQGEVSDVAFTPGAVTGTGTVTFATDLGGEAVAMHSLDDGETWIASAPVDAAAGEIPVIGLRVASTLQLKVVVTDGGDAAESEPIEVDTEPPPEGTAPFQLTRWQPEASCLDGGYVLFSTISQRGSNLGILDRDGKYVWAYANDAADTLIGRVRPGRDGRTVLWNVAHDDRVDDLAYVYRMQLDGSGRTETRTLNGHHDFVELPDETTIAWLGYDFEDLALADLGTSDPDPVAVDTIHEGPEGLAVAEDAVEVWNMLDPADWPYGITVSGPEMEKCPTVPDADPGFLPGSCEYSHGNSLAYLPEDDAYLAMFRWLDALVKVDRASGEVVWVFGGTYDMFTGADADRFVHGHFSDAWKDEQGLLHVLIVDNHDADSGEPQEDSKYTEFVLDEAAMTFERTWVYQSDKFESLLGDIRRIPLEGCDHLLISFSAQGRMVEMTRAGDIVWDVGLPLGNVTSRVHFLADLYDFTGVAYP
jgi:hypothetical protein